MSDIEREFDFLYERTSETKEFSIEEGDLLISKGKMYFVKTLSPDIETANCYGASIKFDEVDGIKTKILKDKTLKAPNLTDLNGLKEKHIYKRIFGDHYRYYRFRDGKIQELNQRGEFDTSNITLDEFLFCLRQQTIKSINIEGACY